ncbi:hypothetical protein ACFQGT_11435 [Natrialbaceae archaeon GCM10025810]|uniref:hypothetical protein n=1 Tax=Halovalidus salilacus TaxID=3075124 RepID=UPI0036072B50
MRKASIGSPASRGRTTDEPTVVDVLALRDADSMDDLTAGDVTAGIITLDDLLMVTAAELSNASDVIEQQSGSH